MARIRTLKPEIHQDEEVGELSDSAFRLYIGLITQADDAGRLKGDPRLIGAVVWPYQPKTTKQVESWLAELDRTGLILRYTHSDRPFICLPSWRDHQRIDNAAKSRIPEPNKADLKVSRRDSANRGGSPLEGKGSRKGSRKGKESAAKTTADASLLPDNFDPTLATAATRCFPILQRTAEARGAKPVFLLAVARAIESYPAKDHAVVAGKVEHWTVHGNGAKRQAKDIVSRFRNFLEDSADQVRVTKAPETDRSAYGRVEAAS